MTSKYFLFLFLSLVIVLTWSTAFTQSAQKIKQKDILVREEMVVISRHLGVTCTECHNLKNFRDDSKKAFKVSLEHMKWVELLKANGMDGKNAPEATCYMCHRGLLQPAYKEKEADVKVQ